jgi:hypothetical protein
MVRCNSNGVVFPLLPPLIDLVARISEDTKGFLTIIVMIVVGDTDTTVLCAYW